MFYSKSAGGFYDETIHSFIPDDGVEISSEYYVELMLGQSAGKMITCENDGYPFLKEPPPASDEVLALNERAWRDARLFTTDGVVSRHRDELEEDVEITLTTAQYVELQVYRRALRNWPESGEFPLSEHRPVAPAWLSEVNQLTPLRTYQSL